MSGFLGNETASSAPFLIKMLTAPKGSVFFFFFFFFFLFKLAFDLSELLTILLIFF